MDEMFCRVTRVHVQTVSAARDQPHSGAVTRALTLPMTNMSIHDVRIQKSGKSSFASTDTTDTIRIELNERPSWL